MPTWPRARGSPKRRPGCGALATSHFTCSRCSAPRLSQPRFDEAMNPEERTLVGTRRLANALRALALDFGNRELGLLGVARVCPSFAAWAFALALAVYGFEAHGAVGV